MNLARRLRRIPGGTVSAVSGRRHPLHSDTGSRGAERQLLAAKRQIKRLRLSLNGNDESDEAVREELRLLKMMRDDLEAIVTVQQAKHNE